MDFEDIQRNLANALAQLMSLRLVVSSPNEKVGDLPALYVLLAALLAPRLCVAALVLGFLFKYRARFERDAMKM